MDLQLAVNLATMVGIVGSLIFAGLQARASSHSFARSAKVAALDAMSQSAVHLHTLQTTWIENPELLPFLAGTDPIPVDEPLRTRVLLAAEMLADCVEGSLEVGAQLEEFGHHDEDWKDYARYLSMHSSAFQVVISESWYKRVREALGAMSSTPEPAVEDGRRSVRFDPVAVSHPSHQSSQPRTPEAKV